MNEPLIRPKSDIKISERLIYPFIEQIKGERMRIVLRLGLIMVKRVLIIEA